MQEIDPSAFGGAALPGGSLPLTLAAALVFLGFYGGCLWRLVALGRRGVKVDLLGVGQKPARARRVELGLKLCSWAVAVLQLVALFATAPVGWDVLGWLGAALAAVGVALFLGAQQGLGLGWRAGTPDPGDAPSLATEGLYRWGRNPAFLGFGLFYLGFLVIKPSWWLAVASLAAWVFMVLQVRLVEEPYLRRELGSAYAGYAASTNRWLGHGSKAARAAWRVAGVLAAIALVCCAALAVYASDYYRPTVFAKDEMAALVSEGRVQVMDGDYVFLPAADVDKPGAAPATDQVDAKAGIVFYPGGKVAPEAYAPLLSALADKGVLCVLCPMPLNLAVLDGDAAAPVRAEFPGVEHWYLMGHSLGGVMAARYLSAHPQGWSGLVLLGSYAADDLSGTDLKVLSIDGSEDHVLNREKAQAAASNLPRGAQSETIPGGNHGQFGSYGEQAGDGQATIAPEEQVRRTADMVLSFVN